MSNRSVSVGQETEELAAAYLASQGYVILARNVRLASGELDIVAEKGGVVYFVEVKARKRGSQVAAREAVTADKQRRLLAAARAWLQKYRGGEVACSFLLAAIENADGEARQVELIEDFLCW